MYAEPFIARTREKEILDRAVQAPGAEFIAVYGRRRVGKTFLVRSQLNRRPYTFFQLTGTHRGSLAEQLQNFADAWQRSFSENVPVPPNWHSAFRYMRNSLEVRLKRGDSPIVLFFDELPWLCGKNHRFLPALEHFWNDWAETQPRLKLVVCGSAASWMVKRVVRARGGLHNRLTRRIRLQSFSVREVLEYLEARRLHYSAYDVVKLYLMLGGIPYYLKLLERGLSVDQNIDAICYAKDGQLATEFEDLYDSLFSAADVYKTIVAALARHHHGLTRRQLVEQLPQGSGGGISQVLENLEASGFVTRVPLFAGAQKDSRIRLIDEFSRFALRFQRRKASGGFSTVAKSASFHAWAGLAFETFCLRHVDMLREALGISGIAMRTAQFWTDGLQIDLVLDRDDNVVNLCEMKLSPAPFIIEKRYAAILRQRVQGFLEATRTRKTPQQVFVTLAGLHDNRYSQELVDKQIRFDALLNR